MILIRPLLLRTLGADPAQLTVEQEGNRLVISRRLSPQEARLARLKTRLADRGAAVEQMRRFMHAAPPTAGVDLKALIDEGRV
ncbi:Uncharacterized protein ToN1_48600 [Aromatoleum petrolei]|nr:Uncharacterized protein ToN1_48600 [Aromatoleum petrolei]